MARIIWTVPALVGLEEIADYISLDKPAAASKFCDISSPLVFPRWPGLRTAVPVRNEQASGLFSIKTICYSPEVADLFRKEKAVLLPTVNKTRGLLQMSFIGDVDSAQLQAELEKIPRLLEDLPSGFILLVDLERLGSMPKECAKEIGQFMEMFDQKGVRQVIRVIPDKSKDIGFQVLYVLHYKNPPPLIVCERMSEACAVLESLE